MKIETYEVIEALAKFRDALWIASSFQIEESYSYDAVWMYDGEYILCQCNLDTKSIKIPGYFRPNKSWQNNTKIIHHNIGILKKLLPEYTYETDKLAVAQKK